MNFTFRSCMINIQIPYFATQSQSQAPYLENSLRLISNKIKMIDTKIMNKCF